LIDWIEQMPVRVYSVCDGNQLYVAANEFPEAVAVRVLRSIRSESRISIADTDCDHCLDHNSRGVVRAHLIVETVKCHSAVSPYTKPEFSAVTAVKLP
jgi:hypothetical protein